MKVSVYTDTELKIISYMQQVDSTTCACISKNLNISIQLTVYNIRKLLNRGIILSIMNKKEYILQPFLKNEDAFLYYSKFVTTILDTYDNMIITNGVDNGEDIITVLENNILIFQHLSLLKIIENYHNSKNVFE